MSTSSRKSGTESVIFGNVPKIWLRLVQRDEVGKQQQRGCGTNDEEFQPEYSGSVDKLIGEQSPLKGKACQQGFHTGGLE